MNWPGSSSFSSCHLFFCSGGLCWQWFREGRGIVEALREEGRLEDRGPVCWPAQINFTVHCLRSLQRDVWSLLGSLSAYPAVQQIQRQVAALPRSFRQGRNTRRRWKARKDQLDISIPTFHLLGLSNFTYFFLPLYRRVPNVKLGASAPKSSPFTSSLRFLCSVSSPWLFQSFFFSFSFFPAWIFDQFALIHSLFNCPGRFETLQSRREIPQIRRQRRFPADGPGLVCLHKSRHQTIALQLPTLRSHQSFGIGLFGTLHGLLPASIQCELARIQRL